MKQLGSAADEKIFTPDNVTILLFVDDAVWEFTRLDLKTCVFAKLPCT